jgi:ferredoxin/nitrate reductase gamma subunit
MDASLLAQAADATREVQWNVTPAMLVFLYGSMVLALLVAGWGTWQRVQVWRMGRPAHRWDRPWARAWRTLTQTLGQTRVLEEPAAGFAHALIFFGFLVLFAATVVVMLHHDLGLRIMQGRFYLFFQSLAVNVFGVLAVLGTGAALYRRYVRRPARFERARAGDFILLSGLLLLLCTGFVISGLRIAATDDPWGPWRPGGYAVAWVLEWASADAGLLIRLHAWTWTLHVATWHAMLAALPYSKLFHVVSATLSVYFSNSGPAGSPPLVDLNAADAHNPLGIGSPFDMTWKQLLELDACTECGRCQDVCPAWAEGKPLSPKRVILDIRDHVRANTRTLAAHHQARRRTSGESVATTLSAPGAPAKQAQPDEQPLALAPLAGGVIREETLWACTTCGACEAACPVSIEHVSLIVQLRQHLVMERGEAPDGVAALARGLEARQHPFRGAGSDRTAWLRDA